MLKLAECRVMLKKEFQINSGYLTRNSLFYITEGKMKYRFDGSTEFACAEDFVCFPCDTFFEREIIEALEFYHVCFENPEKLPLQSGKIPVKDRARLLSTLNYLCNLKLMPEKNERLENYYLNDIFVQLEASNLLANTEKDDIVRNASVYFKKNIDKKISLENVAEQVGVSVSGLIAHFKKITGMTPIHYLTLLRIKKAETLLCHFDSPISKIAADCGFDNAYYFCNTFKKYNDVSPTAYRKKYKV